MKVMKMHVPAISKEEDAVGQQLQSCTVRREYWLSREERNHVQQLAENARIMLCYSA